ncbi:hypothetical protein LWI29_004550 [Acer saccharum]|uniref:Uncharacterized protein n=1 Tax=Acer saccharum TaxID=4024 RepID=A0AA39VAJ6_ACESA|nr:hypothetical protein LWI29_004550 [Acer saccharum]
MPKLLILIAKIGTSSGQQRLHFVRQQATSTSIISRRFFSSFSPGAVTSFSPAAGDFLLPSSPGDSLLLLRRLHLSFPSSPPTSPSVIETKSLVRYNTP